MSNPEKVNAPPMPEAEQVEYWQNRYFTLLDEHAVLINQLRLIRLVLDGPVDKYPTPSSALRQWGEVYQVGGDPDEGTPDAYRGCRDEPCHDPNCLGDR